MEKERLKNYTGKVITSNVLVGSDMQYNIQDYSEKLEYACNFIIEEIGKMKYIIISNENHRIGIQKDIIQIEAAIKTKLAQFYNFENQYTRTIRLLNKLSLHKNNSSNDSLSGGSHGTNGNNGTNAFELSDEQMLLENKAIQKAYFHKFVEFLETRKFLISNAVKNLQKQAKVWKITGRSVKIITERFISGVWYLKFSKI